MKNNKIVIAGGTGFIGQELTNYFGRDNKIIVLTRKLSNEKNNRNEYDTLSKAVLDNTDFVQWDGKTTNGWWQQLEGADVIINLAGKSVNCRYTKKNKEAILNSRIDAVQAIGEAIKKCTTPPTLWINASSATIYRSATDRPQDEMTGEIKDDFSVQVCKQWEQTFFDQHTPDTRKIALRMAITLGSGGVMIPYFNLLKFGLGGSQGNGRQQFSWIHIEDTCRIIEWITERKELAGVFNCCAPNPVTNKELMQTLRSATKTRFGLPAYTWMLKLGAAIIGTETELVLKSRWVIPTKLLQAGFQFNFPFLNDALTDIIKKVPKKQYKLY
jgi:uncharacterized protein